MDIARFYLEQGSYETALVIGSESVSPALAPIFLGKYWQQQGFETLGMAFAVHGIVTAFRALASAFGSRNKSSPLMAASFWPPMRPSAERSSLCACRCSRSSYDG